MIRPFIHGSCGISTVEALADIVKQVDPTTSIFSFAYATMSGLAEFRRRFGDRFFGAGDRWLVGIDHGRTEPQAIKLLMDLCPAQNVRIHRGLAVAATSRFRPARDFHMKGCYLANSGQNRAGFVAGSGNLSRGGLAVNIEMGVAITCTETEKHDGVLEPVVGALGALFDAGDLAADVFPIYEPLWVPSYAHWESADPTPAPNDQWDRFWIDVGYVTRNRGPKKAGNQFDMPRGVHRFFGLVEPPGIVVNTAIGSVTFIDPQPPVVRRLRLGNNQMEKITLPLPEALGLGAYDGTVLEFCRAPGGYRLATYSPDEFGAELAATPDHISHEMGSHRRYGFRNDA